MLCLYDQTEHKTLQDLLKHLRKLKIKQEVYFNEIAPQRDLQTGEAIPFKAPAERYLKTEFANKNNLKKYLKENANGKDWAIRWLSDRRREKQLVYPPSQVELRSLLAPTAQYYDSIGGYNKICTDLRFKIRFDREELPSKPLECPIVVDTREQSPLNIKGNTIVGTLKVGDYGLPSEYDSGVYIERKSLSDFVGTLSERTTKNGDSNLLRFTRELERAQESGCYVVMLVECNINDALGFNFLPPHKCPPFVRYCKTNPEHIFKNLRDLLVQFPMTFQTLFVDGRVQAAAAVAKILSSGESARTVDLQLAYETERLSLVN